MADPRSRAEEARLSHQRADAAGLGRVDQLIPPVYADEFTSRIRTTRIEIIKHAGHMLPYEQPEAFVRVVRKFLES